MDLKHFDTEALRRVYDDPIKAKDPVMAAKNAELHAEIREELERRGAFPPLDVRVAAVIKLIDELPWEGKDRVWRKLVGLESDRDTVDIAELVPPGVQDPRD